MLSTCNTESKEYMLSTCQTCAWSGLSTEALFPDDGRSSEENSSDDGSGYGCITYFEWHRGKSNKVAKVKFRMEKAMYYISLESGEEHSKSIYI